MALRWPADYVVIETEQRKPVRVTAGPAHTTPLYLACRDDILHGSWNMGRMRSYATGLSPKEATRMLAYHPRYSYETAFTGIWRLTERATATFGGDLFIRYPDPVLHAGPRELADGADVLTAFAEAIDAALSLRPIDPATTTFHLTGGLDSGSIATRAALHWPGQLNTATLVITGAGREHQVRRRGEILSRVPFGPHDVQVDTASLLMFGPDCDRTHGELVSPYDEPLYEHMTALNTRMAAAGARTVVSGLGGDEMVAVGSAESAQAALAHRGSPAGLRPRPQRRRGRLGQHEKQPRQPRRHQPRRARGHGPQPPPQHPAPTPTSSTHSSARPALRSNHRRPS